MPSYVGVFISPQYHRHGIPSCKRSNPMLDILIAWDPRLDLYWNRIDIRRLGMKWLINTIHTRMRNLLIDQIRGTVGAFVFDHTIECL